MREYQSIESLGENAAGWINPSGSSIAGGDGDDNKDQRMVQRRVRSASVFPHLQQPLLSLAIFSPLNDKDYGDMRTIEDAR